MTYHLGPVDPGHRAELYGDTRDEEPQPRPRRVLATALALLVMGLFGGGLWFAYVQDTRHAGGDATGGSIPLIRADLGEKGIYYRILTGPVADQAAAERICGELKQRSVGCIVAR